MRRACGWPVIIVIALCTVVVPAARSNTATGGPSATQVRRAIQGAYRSKQLWATINICDTRRHPHVLGIRGQMPALGFRADLRMYFGVDYWDATHHRFQPDSAAADHVVIGPETRGAYQEGVGFKFPAHAGLLRGRVRYEWRLGRQVIGSAERLTGSGHHGARYGDPARFSAAQCRIL